MRGRRQERIEAAVDHVAAAVLGGAIAYALYQLLGNRLALSQLLAGAAIGGVLTYLLTARTLRGMQAQPQSFDFPVFRMADLELADMPELLLTDQAELLLTDEVELVLTDADRVKPRRTAEEELVLNDILAKLGPDSRVVRLFDPAATPTPGQLQSRIDRYLSEETPASPDSDASKALYDALAELRRSLR
ncbi:MAG TPA: hypothetical protein VNS11_01235 [Sphingomicrobium sp.]|nr:hypothetical protein [Sphingomicrobium sp.]